MDFCLTDDQQDDYLDRYSIIDEEPDHIIMKMLSDVAKEMLKEDSVEMRDSKKVIIIKDRREAITNAIHMAKSGDSVVIAEKGHENYQEIRNKIKLSFEDAKEADNILKIINNI